MIIGVGVDIVSVERVRKIHVRYGKAFEEKILSANERQELTKVKDRAAFIAKRFAAKEAVSKALGTGISKGLRFVDIEVVHNDLGRPGIAFSGKALNLSRRAGVAGAHLSIADEKDYAIAHAVLLGDPAQS